jgi:uncharacterized YigZ family protein
MFLYRSVYEYGEAEYVIEKSRFIAHVSPAETPEEARLFISEIKEKYKDATHNVPAFVCGAGSEHQWASDDGEPAGTSGMPVLKLLTSSDLTNTVVVVTRYFGGIKLGTGGLARAYTHAAGLAVDKAGICEVRESSIITYSFDYTFLNRLQNASSAGAFEMDGITYSDVVTAQMKCPAEEADKIKSMISDITGGKADLIAEESAMARYLSKPSI